jgi:hypothetical protein
VRTLRDEVTRLSDKDQSTNPGKAGGLKLLAPQRG